MEMRYNPLKITPKIMLLTSEYIEVELQAEPINIGLMIGIVLGSFVLCGILTLLVAPCLAPESSVAVSIQKCQDSLKEKMRKNREKRPLPVEDIDLKSGHKKQVTRKKTAGAGDGHLTAGHMSATDYEHDVRSSKDGKPPLANRVYPLTDIEGENG
jgi:hypothetical protein